jgi:hypothetical protein
MDAVHGVLESLKRNMCLRTITQFPDKGNCEAIDFSTTSTAGAARGFTCQFGTSDKAEALLDKLEANDQNNKTAFAANNNRYDSYAENQPIYKRLEQLKESITTSRWVIPRGTEKAEVESN